uniref:Uncharacterized protein n=1 Tax=Lactuca sativa TaxID=4236 RepID=A0A9R1V3Z9_LACSA|nr:hypothetical protein LSAT_V11C700361140 [Lactuca sativa]
MEFDSFYNSPYRVQSYEHNDAPLTKKHLNELNAKLDTIMASSSSSNPNSKSAIQKMLDTFVKAHETSISRATAATTASTKAYIDATKKGAAELNASKVTNSITNLEEAFAAEKQNFVNLRHDIQKDNAALLSSLNESFTKLQDDLAMENSLMDELVSKTTQLKTKNLQLSQANNEVNQLRSERAVVNSCVSDGHAILLSVLEAHDPILTISARHCLVDKFRPALGMLSRIEGVSEAMVPSEQGGDGLTSSSQPPPMSQPPPTSQSGPKDKGKGPIVEDSDDEEEIIAEALNRKAREREIDLNAKIVKEAKERERRLKEAQDLLESKKTLFPFWTLEKLLKEAIDSPSTHWLELVVSLDCANTKDSQFDMPITRKAFVFHCFLPIAEVLHPDPKKIITVRVLKPQAARKFINVKLKVTRGSALSEHTFSLADLPNLNPHDWIVLHNILLANPVEYDPIIDHLKRLLVCYVLEVAKVDQEVTSVLRKNPSVLRVGSASDVNKMKMEKIDLVEDQKSMVTSQIWDRKSEVQGTIGNIKRRKAKAEEASGSKIVLFFFMYKDYSLLLHLFLEHMALRTLATAKTLGAISKF